MWLPYAQMKTVSPPLPVARTQGARIFLADGRELIDGIASWWTACHGYNHPHIRQAVEAQLATMPHVMFGGLVHEQALRLAGRLAGLLPGGLERVFFSDSGSVAVEVAMKMATQYWLNRGAAAKNSSWLFAVRLSRRHNRRRCPSVIRPVACTRSLAGVVPKHHIIDLPEASVAASALEKLLKDRTGTIAAIIVEPMVQGAGGMKFHDASVLQRSADLADKNDALLIFDEVFTGFGRTGTMFACEQAGAVPRHHRTLEGVDRRHAAPCGHSRDRRNLRCLLVGRPGEGTDARTTYMANALGCAAANASLDLFEREPRLVQVADIAVRLLGASNRAVP